MIKFIAFSDMRCPYTVGSDSHIADCDAKKIEELTSSVTPGCRFIASLGDIIDGNSDSEKSTELINDILYSYDRAAAIHAVMGERESVLTKRGFMKLGDYAMRYRAFDVSDYRCIFLDTCIGDASDVYGTTDQKHGFEVDDEQFAWLSRLLGKSHRPAIIFSHAPIAVSKPENEKFVVKNSSRLRDLIENSGKVALVLSGHMDNGDCIVSRGVPYITLSPMYKTVESTFSKVSVSSSGIEIEGFGSQESLSIANVSKEHKLTLSSKLRSVFKKH